MLSTRLTACQVCGALATIDERRPAYSDGQAKASVPTSRMSFYEEDINCPQCGLRTQDVEPDLQPA